VSENDEWIETPDVDELRYHKVGFIAGEEVDLRLTAIGNYKPENATKNGRSGCLGQINVNAGSEAHILFEIVKTGTNTVAALNTGLKQNFTVLDMDQSKIHQGGGPKRAGSYTTEEVWVKDFSNKGDTRMDPSREVDGWSVFEAPDDKEYREVKNPESILEDSLDQKQIDASVSLTYEDRNSWEVKFVANTIGFGKGRNFLWAGATSSCDVTPVCACTPDEKRRHPTIMDHYMRWDMCGEEPIAGDGHVLRYPKVAQMVTADGSMTTAGAYIDLIVDNMTEYHAGNPARNGRNGCLGVINLASPGDVEMKFTLVEAGTDKQIRVDSQYPLTYDFNIFDFDQSARGQMQEQVGVSGYSRLIARPPGMQQEQDESTGMTWVKSVTEAVDNPETDIRKVLTTEQLLSSFSVSYRGQTSWNIVLKAESKKKGAAAKKEGTGRNFLFSGESCASWRFYECQCPSESRNYRAGRKRKNWAYDSTRH
jgi:hypothetical protein